MKVVKDAPLTAIIHGQAKIEAALTSGQYTTVAGLQQLPIEFILEQLQSGAVSIVDISLFAQRLETTLVTWCTKKDEKSSKQQMGHAIQHLSRTLDRYREELARKIKKDTILQTLSGTTISDLACPGLASALDRLGFRSAHSLLKVDMSVLTILKGLAGSKSFNAQDLENFRHSLEKCLTDAKLFN